MSRISKGKSAKKSFFIITEGESEERYFSLFRQFYRCSGVKIKKINPCSGQIINKAKVHWQREGVSSSKYSKRIVIIDRDSLSEVEFNNIRKKALDENIDIVFSNESFEVWLLAHFEDVTKGRISLTELKRRLTNYLGQEYKKGDIGQIKTILRYYDRAIENTKNVNEISYHEQCTNVSRLCQEIL